MIALTVTDSLNYALFIEIWTGIFDRGTSTSSAHGIFDFFWHRPLYFDFFQAAQTTLTLHTFTILMGIIQKYCLLKV